jgi:hypothetical protein
VPSDADSVELLTVTPYEAAVQQSDARMRALQSTWAAAVPTALDRLNALIARPQHRVPR